MPSFVPTSPDTLEDSRLYTQARMTDVACLDCLATVGVKKNSDHQTSIQWSAAARAACPELAKRDADDTSGRREVHKGCPRMMASIEAAVRDGSVAVGAYDGY